VADNYGLATIGIRPIEICGALPDDLRLAERASALQGHLQRPGLSARGALRVKVG
jgi:hypothetical protein